MADKLKKYRTYRTTYMNEIHIIRNLAERAKLDETVRTMFKVRCVDLYSTRDEFLKQHNAVVTTLLTLPDSDVDIEDGVREVFLEEYYFIKGVYTDLFESLNSSTASPGLNSTIAPSRNTHQSHVNLPKIELPKFGGDYKAFPSYLELFNALVHSNTSLTEIEKFNYLVSSLQGAPLSLVRTLPLISDNYEIAYHTLEERYAHTRLRAQAHWLELENSAKVPSDNTIALRKLLDTFSENLAALNQMKFPTEHWDFLLVMMILKRLDHTIVTRFELEHNSSDIPTYKHLIDFLNKHCAALETINFSQSSFHAKRAPIIKPPAPAPSPNRPSLTSTFFINKSPTTNCALCKENHSLYTCAAFAAKSESERYSFCRSAHLCFNCLSSAHDIRSCKSNYTCKKCKSRYHHTLLHIDKLNHPSRSDSNINSSNNFASQSGNRSNQEQNSSPLSHSSSPSYSANSVSTGATSSTTTCLAGTQAGSLNTSVLLATAWIDILDSRGEYQPLRCIIDSGSMSSFVTGRAVRKLGLPHSQVATEIKGIGTMQYYSTKGQLTLAIKPAGKDSPLLFTDAIILNKICDNLPTSKLSVETWSRLSNLQLADRNFYSPAAVDVLLGADIFPKILLNGKISGNTDAPQAINTVFGYIVMGRLENFVPSITPEITSFLSYDVEGTLSKFWEVEEIPGIKVTSPEELLCEEHFSSTHFRNSSGRYTVFLPFRNPHPTFPKIRDLALTRFHSLERRLIKQPHVYTQYKDFMREYLELNHMSLVHEMPSSDRVYYIPHHCVLKPESSTTKLRVVFNGSAKLPNQHSLNDCLLTGPKLQQDIVTILMNFRCHAYAICTDIRQMYRMILIDSSHRDYQRIVWRFSPEDPIQDYVLNTVVYGLTSSPYLALRILLQLADDEGKRFPVAADAIRRSSYVDDFVCGTATLEEARNLVSELIALMELGGFELRKWSTNEPSLLKSLPPSHLSNNPLSFDPDTSLKILGLHWNPTSDCFAFSVKAIENRSCTKRSMLSELARVYDPLGFLAPVTFFTKYLIQRLWVSNLGWDDPPSDDIIRVWTKYKNELPLLSNLKIRRHLMSAPVSEIHGFCDASERGYACVIYLRNIYPNSRITTHFVCGKSKVAPLKKITIPRLELCAAVMLSKLVSFVKQILEHHMNLTTICAWSDSQIALHWIKRSPHESKTFVANRVTYVQDRIPPNNWFYVDSKNNSADVASRGLFPSELINDMLWFHGPEFLRNSRTPWLEFPASSFNCNLPHDEERKLIFFTQSHENNFIDELLHKFSSFAKLQRVIAFSLRFTHNCSNPSSRNTGFLNNCELFDALLVLVKRTQQIHFAAELHTESFPKPLRKLQVFKDENFQILRVGGRLKYSSLPNDAKFPMLLPRNSRLTTLLIEFYHKKHLHAGFRTTQFLLSQKFWILSPKRAINSVLTKCVRCWKTKPTPFQPPMGDLPASRISQVKPFSHVGVDYGGPFLLTMTRHRGVKTCKGYLCVFVCFTTKAIHLELASDLTTDTFLAALQRFIARRGRVSHIYSDNGTNFQGASRELLNLMKNAAAHEHINHTFIPAASPHWGGLWESGVKSVKGHLSRVIGQQLLTYEEFYTVLVLIESTLNSRPLGPLTHDIEDINALTPNHFLTLEPTSAIPLPDFTPLKLNSLSRWQMIQRLHQDFWKRWHLEYLHTLQQRSKWLKPNSPTPTVGAMVLIKAENTPPTKWVLGRITSLHPGRDGVARVATVKTSNGTLTRSLVKLCPLPKLEAPDV